MRMTGEVRIAAPRERVWAALNDAEVLQRCIPGCEELEKTSATEFAAKVKAKIGPVSAKFAGSVTLSDLNPPESYAISGEGKGGAAGFAKGGAKVRLSPEGEVTLLTYEVEGRVGGKLANIGSRLVDGAAKKMADDFFGRFVTELSPAEPAEPAAPPAGEAAAPALSEEAGPGVPPGVWVTGLLVIVLLLLAIFGLG